MRIIAALHPGYLDQIKARESQVVTGIVMWLIALENYESVYICTY